MPKKAREFDLIVYGAASFVGQILSRYLFEQYGCGDGLKWAIAGRNQAKLDAVKKELGATELTTIIADAADKPALADMAANTKVVVSTVGPYALYGSDLVAACVENGTDYCDLTGETQWMRKMIDQHQAAAEKSGARIVHNCGFDSIPSDLGVWFTQNQAQAQFGEPCTQIKMRVKAMKGGASGGTVASMVNVMKEAAKDPALRKMLQNPYAVAPQGQRRGVRQPNVTKPEYDKDAKAWLAPFVMAAINTRVVQRSHALQGRPWGEEFLYDEAMLMGDGAKGRLRATSLALGLGGFVGLAALAPTRKVLEKFVLPKPGEGPSPDEQKNGFYDLRFYGKTASGKTLKTKVTGDRDPGYGSTAKMLGEAAVCLAKDITRRSVKGGFWTPSTAFGEKLQTRLVTNAGLTFENI